MRTFMATLLLIGCALWAQVTPGPLTPPPTASQPPAEVPPDGAVITIKGYCPQAPAGTDPKSPDCKTVITRAQFEKLMNTLAPGAPPSARQQLAGEYVRTLILSTQAEKLGLEKSPQFNEIMGFMKLRVLSQLLMTSLQEKAKPTAADVQQYYQTNAAKYEEMSLKRVFIPRSRPAPAGNAAAPKEPTDAELKADGEKALTRLKAGESFDKVQKDVYEASGYKTPPPPTAIPNWRHDTVPAGQQALFNLKKGEYSTVMIEAAGAYVYQVEDHKTIPLEQVKSEIETQLANENLQKELGEFAGSIQPDINQSYMRGGDRQVQALTPPSSPAPATPKASTPTPKK